MHSRKEKPLIPSLVLDKHTYLAPQGGNAQLSRVGEVAQTWSGSPLEAGGRGVGVAGRQHSFVAAAEQKPSLQAGLQPSQTH